MTDNNANFDLLEKAITLIKNKNDKQKPDTQLKCRAARVVSYDEDAFQAIVCFIDDNQNNEYALINKTNEKLSENDTVKVYYTTNAAKGWIGARMGEPRPIKDSSGGGITNILPLVEYNVSDNNSIKYNNITYNYEFRDDGLITKITDDKGGEFSPTFADGVTDIVMHNATFLAVAMISGLKQSTSGWVLKGLVHQNIEVVTEPKSFDTGITATLSKYTIEICMQFDGVGNSSSNQSSTLFHIGGLSSDRTALKIASCDYHPEALDYQIFGYWHFDTVGDYTTFPSHKGELSTITLTVSKTSEHDSRVKVYSNGELLSTKYEGWYYVSLSDYMLLNAKDIDRTALGTVYQVRIYDRVLTDAEVAQNANEDRRYYG